MDDLHPFPRGAPRTSLNGPIGGVRALLAARGEAVPAVHAALPVAGPERGQRSGNRSGIVVVRLPLSRGR